jgi:hypothetical protein
MRNLISAAKTRLIPLLGASVLLTGGIGASVLLTGGLGTSVMLTAETADAATCAGANAEGVACTITGTLLMTGGAMTLTTPTALGWAETVTGLDQTVVDTNTLHQTYQVNDATGTAPGWHVTASATAFATTGLTPNLTLGTAAAITPTFSTNGSITSMTAVTAPTAACLTGSTCTVPTSPVVPVAYPVTITAGAAASAAPVNIYDTALGTGTGTINVGLPGGAPVGWWLNVPSNTIVDTYISTVSLELITGP